MIRMILKDRFVREEGLSDAIIEGEILDVNNGNYVVDRKDNGVLTVPKNQIWEYEEIEDEESEGDDVNVKDMKGGVFESIIEFKCEKNSRDFRCEKKPCVLVSDSRRMQGVNHDFIEICGEAEDVSVDGELNDDFTIISGEIMDGSDFEGTFVVRDVEENHHYENGDVIEEVNEMVERRK